MFRLLLAAAILFALTQTGTAEQNNPRGKFFKPQIDSVRLDHRELPSWKQKQPRVETGIASWYGPGFHGRLMANGERFNMHRVSVAHKTIPLGSVVRVTNLENGRAVVAEVTDRGPFVHGRIVDLSRKAAEIIGAVHDGVVPVKVEVLHKQI